jgi:hypothetical protein
MKTPRKWTITKTGFATSDRKKAHFRLRSGPLGQVLQSSIGFFAFFFLFPSLAFANIEITEIMYDAPGADTGREWIEVTNTGEDSIDIGKYKLFENGTNHGLAVTQGSSLLAPHTSAILADNPEKFLADYPAYSGAIFNTAFSLSNTGESIAIKNASSSVLDTADYTSTEDADGTGGSLQKINASFEAWMANPGAYPGTLTAVPKKEVPVKAAPAPKKTSTKTSVKKSTTAASAVSKFDTAPAPAPLTASVGSFVPQIPSNILWYLGLAAIILLGVGGTLFLMLNKKETFITADEFKIE